MSDIESPTTFQRPLIPNPCLIAILLVVRDTTEVDFVFHYPPHPRMGPTPNTTLWRSGNSGTSSESSAYSTSEDEEEENRSRSTVRVRHSRRGPLSATGRSDTMSRSRSFERRSSRHGHHVTSDHEFEEDDEDDASPGPYGHDWDHVLGFKKEVLASLLSPAKSICKRRFELAVHNTVFLGYPVHVRADGSWRKRSKRWKRSGRREGKVTDDDDEDEDDDGDDAEDGDDEDENADADGDEADDEDNGEQSPVEPRRETKLDSEPQSPIDSKSEGRSLKSSITASSTINTGTTGGGSGGSGGGGGGGGDSSTNAKQDSSTSPKGSETSSKMTMFHVVFVMNPPQLEYHSRIADMYERVCKPFTRGLKLEQASDNFVRREAELILEIREKAARNGIGIQDLWNQILNKSNLAYNISKVYQAISQSKIAHILINDKLDFSLQIPLVSQISSLPSLIDAQLPGLYLTTANSFGNTDSEEDSQLVQHYSLLFIEEPDRILKEVASEPGPWSSMMTQFIKCIHATLPFTQVAQETGLSLRSIEVLARHLIYWRKARAIPPLHHRNYYIVSPNADMKKITQMVPEFQRIFPTLHSLPEILSMLSGKPRPYSTFMPSRDHKMLYLDILAWLMRHGWVIQLRSFAWVKITRDIKVKVAEREHLAKLEAVRKREEAEREMERSQSTEDLHHHHHNHHHHHHHQHNQPPLQSAMTDGAGDTRSGMSSELASDNNSDRSLPVTPIKEQALNGAIRLKDSLTRRDRVSFAEQLRGRSPNPSPARSGVSMAISSGKSLSGITAGASSSSLSKASAVVIDPNDYQDSILADPMRPTPLESRWMEQLTKEQPPDVVALFDRIAKYLNGQNAMEMIALREGISRKEVRRVINALDENLVFVRHW